MSENPKHPWFRFHLLTAVLGMLAAGMLLWQDAAWHFSEYAYAKSDGSIIGEDFERGWPRRYEFKYASYPGKSRYPLPPPEDEQPSFAFDRNALLWDIVVGVAVLVAIGIIVESIIRRRQGRRAEQ